MILSIRKVALIEKGSPDTVVVLSAINEGVDGSSVFGISNESEEIIIEGGQTYINANSPSIDIRTLKPSSSDFTQIQSWADNQTDLHVACLAIDGGVFMGDRDTGVGVNKISINEQLTDSDVLAIKITKKSTIGYDESTGIYSGGFWAGENILGSYEWGDSNSNNIADGWVNAANRFSVNFDAVNNQQDLTDNDSGDQNRFQKQFYFPFEGESLTFSLSIDALNKYTGTYTSAISINLRNASGTIIDSGTTSVTGTGRSSLTITTPASMVWGIVEFTSTRVSAGTQPAEYSISNPMITINGLSTYTKF